MRVAYALEDRSHNVADETDCLVRVAGSLSAYVSVCGLLVELENLRYFSRCPGE